MNELQASLLEAINTLSRGNDSNNIQTVTIEGIITSIEDLARGIYKVKYQNSLITVYSTGAIYNIGQHVYVIVPNGDFSKNKIILGPSAGLNNSIEIENEKEESKYLEVTKNLFDNFIQNNEKALCSYNHEIISYNQNNLIDFQAAFKRYTKFKLSCDIKTSLPIEQQKAMGQYGLKVQYITNKGVYEVKLDTSNILGNPYSLNKWTHQFITFDIPSDIEVNDVFIFWYADKPFLEGENQSKDIFFKNIQLTALMEIPIISGYYLYLVPNNGLIFTDNVQEISIIPDLKLDGKSVNLKTKTANCYWFIQDNSIINANNDGFFSLMGARWRCLNDKNEEGLYISDNNYKLTILSDDVLSNEKYKCLIIYDNISYQQEVQLEQFNDKINFRIIADSDEYAAGIGQATLTAIYDYMPDAAYPLSYSWARYDKYGNYIDSDWWSLAENNNSKVTFDIEKIDVKNTFTCSIVSPNYKKPIATATYEIMVKDFIETKLILYNTNVIYKYDANGISPFSPDYGGGIGKTYESIKPIYFKLFKPDGTELSEAEQASCTYTWTVPENTMLDISGQWFNSDKKEYIIPTRDFVYGIRNYYAPSRTDNTVTLTVVFNGVIYKETFEIQFLKDGANGTNGTDYVAFITTTGPENRIIIEGSKNQGKILGARKSDGTLIADKIKLNIVVYHLGQEIDMLRYSNNITLEMVDPNNTPFVINGYYLTIPTMDKVVEAIQNNKNINIIRAKIIIDNNITIYAYKVIEYFFYAQSPNVNNFSIDNGPFEVLFNSDGSKVQSKAADAFVAMYDEIQNGENVRIIDTTLKENSWSIGSGFSLKAEQEGYHSSRYLIINDELGDNIYTLLNVSGNHIDDYWEYYRPILLRKNTYGMSALNTWDGTRLQLNEEGNYIFAAQVGAGTKDSSNNFTGIILGKTKDGNNIYEGLLGYNKGNRSIFLDATNGKAEFGIDSKGRIIIDPNNSNALIYGGNYNSSDKTGMLIDLTTPRIHFGSNNFEVNQDGILTAQGVDIKGKITATEGGIGGWDINENSISNSQDGGSIYITSKKDISSPYWISTYNAAAGGGTRTFSISKLGDIYAISGTIGGWTLSNDAIYNNTNSMDSTSVGTYIGINGIKQYASGNAFVTIKDGILTAQGVDIKGKITATEGGTIGGYKIGTSSLTTENGQVGMSSSSTNYAFWAGNAVASAAPFRVSADGALTCSNINVIGGSLKIGNFFTVDENGVNISTSESMSNIAIKGKLTTATGSSIGGWQTDKNSIFSGGRWSESNDETPDAFMCTGSDGTYTIGGSSKIDEWIFGAGGNFGVRKNGEVYCSSIKVTGTSTEDSQGQFTGTTQIGKMTIAKNGTGPYANDVNVFSLGQSGQLGYVVKFGLHKVNDENYFFSIIQVGDSAGGRVLLGIKTDHTTVNKM